MKKIPKKKVSAFQREVYAYFKKHGRVLPWRTNITPYRIFISEVMLQQTQVDRVIDKFTAFVKAFPSFRALAKASFPDVLAQWQGLGYNRRALFLHTSAKKVVSEFRGRLPSDPEVLATFPGIGKATAASICAFGFNEPTVFVETNIRSVFIHHFFDDRTDVHDDEIYHCVVETLDRDNAYRWYSALMDYGVHLKKMHGNPSRKSRHHVKQSRFEGSDRQVRGNILKALTKKSLSVASLVAAVNGDPERVKNILNTLKNEGFIETKNRKWRVKSG